MTETCLIMLAKMPLSWVIFAVFLVNLIMTGFNGYNIRKIERYHYNHLEYHLKNRSRKGR